MATIERLNSTSGSMGLMTGHHIFAAVIAGALVIARRWPQIVRAADRWRAGRGPSPLDVRIWWPHPPPGG
jgi:hypothetical protein